MILWKCLHFCEENAASQQNVGTVGLSYFSDIRVKPAAPGPKTPGGDPETGAAQRRGEAVRQRPLGLRVDLIQEHGVAQPLRQNGLSGVTGSDAAAPVRAQNRSSRWTLSRMGFPKPDAPTTQIT